MSGERVEIGTKDGVAPAWLFKPDGQGPWPGVIVFMDFIGVRPALRAMSERFAAAGYVVLLPELFYRAGERPELTPQQVFGDQAVLGAQYAQLQALTNTRVREDTAAYLDFLTGKAGATGRIGAVGYCMGGRCALTAAGAFPEAVKAAASFHGAQLASDAEDSPHRAAATMKARIYVGVAGIDEHFTGAEEGRLAQALYDAGVDHAIETYAGARHGFAVTDTPVYDRAASERHFARTLSLFEETLR